MKRRILRSILFVLALAVFLCSGGAVVRYFLQMQAGAKQAGAVAQKVVSTVFIPSEQVLEQEIGRETEATVGETEVEATGEVTDEASEAAPSYAPIRVDFDVLLSENPDVVAWLYVPDTPIHYPVVQAEDNAYYLHRLLDGSNNSAGTLFLDCRNAPDFSDWNSVIYGHNMLDDSMFGSLPDYETQAYFEAHPVLYLLTPEQDYAVELIAGFTTAPDASLYRSLCSPAEEREKLLAQWMESSDFSSDIRPTAEDRLVTLSTCTYTFRNARYVVIGVLRPLDRVPE